MAITKHLKTAMDVTTTICAIVIVGLLVRSQWRMPNDTAVAAETIDRALIDAQSMQRRIGDSKLVLVEFADYQCPFCSRHAKDTFPRIKRELIDSGRISYAYFHFPLQAIHANAFHASEAAECSRKQGKYWEMHARLFENPSRLNPTDLLGQAKTLGLELTSFEQCLSGEVSGVVTADIEHGTRLGVEGTPSLFIGTIDADGSAYLERRLTGAVPFESIEQVINELSPARGRWYSNWF